ncbi:hypothetical protein NQZ79_g1889 [Umbelopsis isabellina]|nr:hypothetical protein NQZ79_g1889 [Umbelopsis isabellina]
MSPNILATGSSELGESSYSHHPDWDIGVAVIDSYTYYNLEFLENIDMSSNKTLQDLFNSYDAEKIKSTPGIRSDLFRRPLDQVRVTDFFGSVQSVELTPTRYNLTAAENISSESYADKASVDIQSSQNDDKLRHKSHRVFHVKQQDPTISTYILYFIGAGVLLMAMKAAQTWP